MRKLVYLFELDSVRKTDREIELGQQALYDEIVGNGNKVVLTFNQLVDSRGFFSLLDREQYYNDLVTLFEKGAVCISQYGDVRTIAQYLINSLAYGRSFIYSGWPLKSTQKRLLALIKRSLMYSDLTEINDYLSGFRSKDELLDLFIEIGEDRQQHPTTLTPDQCSAIIKKLFWLLKTILRLSSIHTIYIDPKPADEYKMSLPKFLRNALSLAPTYRPDLWEKAKEILISLGNEYEGAALRREPIFVFESGQGSIDRSDYHHAIKRLCEKTLSYDKNIDISPYQFAEAIVDLCYNYQLEYSICNSSKHYNLSEFSSPLPADWVTFSADFFARLEQTWRMGDNERRYLLNETNVFDEFTSTNLPDLGRAIRIVDYTKKERTPDQTSGIHRYEFKLRAQRKQHKSTIESSIGKRLLLMTLSVGIACILELAIQTLQNYIDTMIPWNFVIETLVFLVGTELFTTILSHIFPGFLSLSEAVGSFTKAFGDLVNAIFHKDMAYVNNCPQGLDKFESYKKGIKIDFVRSNAIKQYLSLRGNRPALFNESDIYPIVDLTIDEPERTNKLKHLARVEELYGYNFGVVYRSKFNTMLVDPILSEESQPEYFPYERIVPTSGRDGVVMIPRYQDKFILIKQYRHAIRSEQYSFPRGYAENGGEPETNAVRELREELGAEVKSTSLLSRVAADSGLTSTQAYVFLAELENMSPPRGHEGITEIISLSRDELNTWVAEGKITDGFTLSAWALLAGRA